MLSTNFGNYVKNRPGFEKVFRSLSDRAWNNAFSLIKEITKRGGAHDFAARISSNPIQQSKMLELSELNSLALALDVEKELAKEAHDIHQRYSHATHKSHYDPEVWQTRFHFEILIGIHNFFFSIFFFLGDSLFGRTFH